MYQGYLLKFGDDVFPFSYIKADEYEVIPNQRLDLDSFQNQLGYLERNVLDHTATKITWSSPTMAYSKFSAMMNFFRSKWIVGAERKFVVTYYDFETDDYKTGNFYMPDYTVSLYHADSGDYLANEVTFKLIEY